MDQPEAVSPVGPDMQAAVTAGDCGLVKDLASDAKSYFANPESRAAQDLAKELGNACKAGTSTTTTELATQLLEMMETALVAGRGGNTAVGSNLANALLACTQGLCNSDDLPAPVINFASAFGTAGTFSIRRGTSEERVMARDWVKFTDQNPVADNWARWGIDVDDAWGVVANVSPVLVYGSPTNTLTTDEPKIGNLQYDFNRWPVVGLFQDDDLHVWVCFANEADVPHDQGVAPEGRMQREGVLLSFSPNLDCPTDAPTPPQAASLFAPFMNVARSVVPRNMFGFVLRDDRRTTHVIGSPLDFSDFAPVGADTAGRLEWVVAPASVVTVGEPLAPGGLEVKAFSGGGTPMEKVAITIAVQNNSGAPAGAEVSAGEALTREHDGDEGIALFPVAAVNKPGGYTICATGVLAGFTFKPICSDMFHARNN